MNTRNIMAMLAAVITIAGCGGGGGGSPTAQVPVTPATPAPTVTLAISQPKVTLGSSATLTWSSTNATSCTASGAWSGTQAISGTSPQTPAAAGSNTYTLTCTGAGGSDSQTATLTISPPVVTAMTFSHCATNTNNPGDTHDTYGNLMLSSTIWNASAATSFSQCINATIDSKLGVTTAQFDWNFVSSNSEVKTFPNIQFGQQTGFPNSTDTTTVLPALVSSMPDLNVAGTITTTCATGTSCYFDSGFDVFFSNTATPTTWPPKAELMILTSYNFPYPLTALGGGATISTVTIDGTIFDVVSFVVTPPPPAGTAPTSWPIIQYYAKTPITKLNLKIKDFVADAINRGVVHPTDYIDMVQVGTEVQSGQGITSLTNYNIQ
jgi:hypothetical protein